MPVCSECACVFEVADARSFFNNYYSQSSKWDYDEVISEALCGSCATDRAGDMWFDGELEDEYSDDEEC